MVAAIVLEPSTSSAWTSWWADLPTCLVLDGPRLTDVGWLW